MDAQAEHLSMLRLLLAAVEGALHEFQTADSRLATDFIADLERIARRTRHELAALSSGSV